MASLINIIQTGNLSSTVAIIAHDVNLCSSYQLVDKVSFSVKND